MTSLEIIDNKMVLLLISASVSLLFLIIYMLYYLQKRIPKVCYIDGIPIFNQQTDQPIPFLDHSPLYNVPQILSTMEWMGQLFQFEFNNQLVLFINDGKVAKYVLDHIHDKASLNQGEKKSIFGSENISTFNTNSAWVNRRSQLQNSCSFANLQKCRELLEAHVNKLQSQLFQLVNSSKEECSVKELFGNFVLEVLLHIHFENPCDYLSDPNKYKILQKAMHDYEKLYESKHFLSNWKNIKMFRSAKHILFRFADEIIDHLQQKYTATNPAATEEELGYESFGSSLMKLAKEIDLTKDQLRSEVLNFLFTGKQSISLFVLMQSSSIIRRTAKKPLEASLTWLVYAMIHNPDDHKRCQSLLDNLMQQNESMFLDSFYPLPAFLEAFLRETLRKYPPTHQLIRSTKKTHSALIPIDTKELLKFSDAGSISVPPNTLLVLNLYTLQNSEHNWGSTATLFSPERWLDNADTNMQSPNPIQANALYRGWGLDKETLLFAPFSYGKRSCMGLPLALWLMRSVFLMMVQYFEFQMVAADEEFKSEQEEEDFHMENHVLIPSNEFVVHVTARVNM